MRRNGVAFTVKENRDVIQIDNVKCSVVPAFSVIVLDQIARIPSVRYFLTEFQVASVHITFGVRVCVEIIN